MAGVGGIDEASKGPSAVKLITVVGVPSEITGIGERLELEVATRQPAGRVRVLP